ncbi:CDP-glycerol glycerophosphotransferase family protein [Halopseudomonas aestusnigri]|uniref:CDP-glycerol glycerophosphotransferase family protein n=1 Tax=Halopseudomonas aestusnigri TaxID=857252 RepID=UPI0025547333|nr:CDP-glycerol glycerophosphotransferase family protein [Halopseudomonas aestusnigri]MDL2198441.1 CDP-glycerol glycerophosphotransferase family protein [Halopseudomonas aestusnigri]
MSAPDILRDVGNNIRELAVSVVGWLLLAPLSALIPKRKDWISVIGREAGAFVDNSKYFYIDTVSTLGASLRVVHVTERDDVVAKLTGAGFEALRYPSWRAAWFLARSGIVVMDSVEWYKNWRRFFLVRARLIQLWHGVGFKRIELEKWRNEAPKKKWLSSRWLLWPRMVRRYLYGRAPMYDAVVATSKFYRDHVFSGAFRSRHFPIVGYPRNAFANAHPLVWVNVDEKIRECLNGWVTEGRRLLFVAPTFRDSRATPLSLDAEQKARIEKFCETHRYEFIFKFHPYERGASEVSGKHMHVLDPRSDAYPLMPFMSGLVTDYSSIYMDYLLLDRPVYFLTPDLEQYISSDRGIQFDFESMTPGPKFQSWDELLEALLAPETAEWQSRRRELVSLAFDDLPQCQATSRLLDFMTSQGWLECRRRKKS